MLLLAIISVLLGNILAAEEYKIVSLAEGDVKGVKYWNGDFYEFYGVKYASVPKGKNRFKGPLPPEPWEGVYEANEERIICPQIFFGEDENDVFVYGEEDCLSLNLFVPTIGNENNLLPVVVYIHSGAYALGHGNMAKFSYLVRHDVIVISINYRLGAVGFLCLGTEEIPGNAGLKDQVAALRWINKNIKKFGGDPNKVTVAGFSVGASMAELLSLSKSTRGLIDKIILDSGSAMSSSAINRDPITTAINIAQSLGYNGTESIEELTEFYMKTPTDALAYKSLHFYLRNGTFGFAPCVENVHEGTEAFLTESPKDIFEKEANQDVSVLIGFSNMEGISRLEQLDSWKQAMEENFSEFLPTDLVFADDNIKSNVVKEIKKYYFGNKTVSNETLEEYINYFSDSMFTYSILNSANRHVKTSKRRVYLYEFSYFGSLSAKHRYMNVVQGASHRDQTSYILDFYSWTNKFDDLDTRDRLTMMWTDFIKYGDPTAYESILVNYKWKNYTESNKNYLSINRDIEMKTDLLQERYIFWNKFYEKYYYNPKAPKHKKNLKLKNEKEEL